MNKLIFILFFCLFTSCNLIERPTGAHMSEDMRLLDSLLLRYEAGDTLGSLDGMKQFVKDFPKADYGFNFLGTLYLAIKEDSLALFNIQKALELNPNNYGALTNYGIILDRNDEYHEAYNYYIRAIRIRSDFTQAYSNLMGNRITVGDLENARKYGEKAVYYGNYITDKGLLCAIYHKLGLQSKRDSLYLELKSLHYVNIEQLEEIILQN